MTPDSDRSFPVVIVLMGVSGVGKTTVGRAVAERLGWDFLDADDLHPPENVAKMRRGEGLTDADREPWLDAVASLIEQRAEDDAPAVVACSGLKAAYRERLHRDDPEVGLVWLDAAPHLIAERLDAREGHFAGSDLLDSQFEARERPGRDENVTCVPALGPVDKVAREVIRALTAGTSRRV